VEKNKKKESGRGLGGLNALEKKTSSFSYK
jgi:hypothetical protein